MVGNSFGSMSRIATPLASVTSSVAAEIARAARTGVSRRKIMRALWPRRRLLASAKSPKGARATRIGEMADANRVRGSAD